MTTSRDDRANLNTWVPASLVQQVKVRAAQSGVKVQDIVAFSKKNVWPAPSARWSMKMPVIGLHKRIRHVGTVAAAKMESRASRAS